MSISWFGYLIKSRKQRDSLHLHHSQTMADYSSRCLWCRENVVALRADEHPGESMGHTGCYMDIFKCDWHINVCVCVRMILRPQMRTYKRPFLFLLVMWSDLDCLLYAFVMFFPYIDISVCVCSRLGSLCLCVWIVCVRVFCSLLCVPASNLCLFSLEPVIVHGFLSLCLDSVGLNSVD